VNSAATPFSQRQFNQGVLRLNQNASTSFSADDCHGVLSVGSSTSPNQYYGGYLSSVILYDSVLTEDQLAINRQVDDWSMSHADIVVTSTPLPEDVKNPLVLSGETFAGTYSDNSISDMSWMALPSGTTGSISFSSNTWSFNMTAIGAEKVNIIATTPSGIKQVANAGTAGFLVAGAHSFFNAQNIDGQWNDTLDDLDAVGTMTNLGTSGLHLAQATSSARPTYVESLHNGLPWLEYDADDFLEAATAAPWEFLHDATPTFVLYAFAAPALGLRSMLYTSASPAKGATYGPGSTSLRVNIRVSDGSANVVSHMSSLTSLTPPVMAHSTIQKLYAGGQYSTKLNSDAVFATVTAAEVTGAPDVPLRLGNMINGHIHHCVIYQMDVTAEQRALILDASRYGLNLVASSLGL
jgi:hypothetical protein